MCVRQLSREIWGPAPWIELASSSTGGISAARGEKTATRVGWKEVRQAAGEGRDTLSQSRGPRSEVPARLPISPKRVT
jgi:hypothetical protein